jgi:Bifunctional DNA primase/polymerase, N-terminal/AAA domain
MAAVERARRKEGTFGPRAASLSAGPDASRITAARRQRPNEASRPPNVAMLGAALEYASRGVPVFPVWGVTDDGRCRCGSAECKDVGKHPLGRLAFHGFKDATTDEPTIRRWWQSQPAANIGTPTETRFVLDVDHRHGGNETLAQLELQHGTLPPTPLVLTGGSDGGLHYHFAMPMPSLGSSAGKLGPGLDTRGVGGYVLLPPSRHKSGRCYLEDPDRALFGMPLAPVPTWMLIMLAGSTPSPNGAPTTEAPDWALLAGAPEGERHMVATRIAGHYLAKDLPPAEVEQILIGYSARCTPAFPTAEARRIVHDLAEKDHRAAEPSADAPAGPVTPLGIGLGQFLRQTFADAPPLIEGVLSADGNGWIAGEEKLGKTYYALDEALALALGQPVAGRFKVPARQRVLFIEEEDPPRRAYSRIKSLLRGRGLDLDDPALLAELDEWFRIEVWSGFTLDDPARVARLDATCAAFRPTVAYLDVLRKLTGRDLNKSAEAGALLASLDAIRRAHGTIFRVLHHYRKAQGFRVARGSQEMGGSFVLGAWGECSLFLEPIGRKQGAVRVEVQSKDAAPRLREWKAAPASSHPEAQRGTAPERLP